MSEEETYSVNDTIRKYESGAYGAERVSEAEKKIWQDLGKIVVSTKDMPADERLIALLFAINTALRSTPTQEAK